MGVVWLRAESRILAAALAMTVAARAAFGQIPSWGIDAFQAPADPRWSPITVQDVEAAYRLLRDNHPGAAPELHDLAFQQRLNNAHTLALKRAGTVSSYQGYLFVLAGFAIPALRLFNVLHAGIRRPGRSDRGRAVPADADLDIADTASLEKWVIAGCLATMAH
jgi:hypothetical protein